MKAVRQMMRVSQKHPRAVAMAGAAMVTVGILLVVMLVCGYAPFGTKSLAVADARIQYLDFFGFLKNVSAGLDSLFYSFSKGLGGSCWTLFAYYLASPFNLLLSFFEKVQINTFFNLIFVLKAALASAFFAWFLAEWFRPQMETSAQKQFLAKLGTMISLAMAYGLCQYMLAQASNIMWLDGVYLLPLLMLATHRIVLGESSWPLALVTALAILFNWYSAGIDCLFILIWFGFEVILQQADQKTFNLFTKANGRRLLKLVMALALGVLTSMVLFWPTILGVLSTQHGSINLLTAMKPGFIGAIPTLIERYSYGAGSTYGAAALYCGGFAAIGLVALLVNKTLSIRKKIVIGGFCAILIGILYWHPLVMLFSLFEAVGSYWYRYSYVVIAAILFLGAYYFLKVCTQRDAKLLLRVGSILAVILILVQFVHSAIEINLVYRSALMIFAIAVLLYAVLKASNYCMRNVGMVLLGGLVLIDMSYATYTFLRNYQEVNVAEYNNYTETTQQTLANLHNADPETYRISATATRYQDEAGIAGATANYNEAMFFNYMGISSYTSMPDENQLALLQRLGYRTDFDIRTIANTSIIGADSLLGVKYVLSDYPINGLLQETFAPADATRQVYRNPYALPLAVVYDANDRTIRGDNPFEYQNQFYSKLLNQEVKLYQPLKYQKPSDSYTYNFTVPAGNYALYGNIPPTGDNPDLMLKINHAAPIAYGRSDSSAAATLTPSVFYIPTDRARQQLTLQLSSESGTYRVGDLELYLLDLDLLAQVTEQLLARPAVEIRLKPSTSFQVAAKAGQELYLSIPYDKGWKIKRNGKVVVAQQFADALMAIPLEDGENNIELSYEVPGLALGIMLSTLGVGGVIVLAYYEKKGKML